MLHSASVARFLELWDNPNDEISVELNQPTVSEPLQVIVVVTPQGAAALKIPLLPLLTGRA